MNGQTEIRESKIPEPGVIAHARLVNTSYADLRHVSCNFANGVLTLRGRIDSYYHKQLAQEKVRHIDGVVQVVNEIEVEP